MKAEEGGHAVGYALVVVEGPDAGQVFVLDGGQLGRAFVGQSATCDLRLTDAGVSRRHLALDLVGEGEGTRLRVTDLAAEGATTVNDVAVSDAFLSGGERVRL